MGGLFCYRVSQKSRYTDCLNNGRTALADICSDAGRSPPILTQKVPDRYHTSFSRSRCRNWAYSINKGIPIRLNNAFEKSGVI